MELKPGYKQTEAGVIPGDWEARPLDELGSLKNGINKGKEDFGYGFPFVNLMDVFGATKISANADLGLVRSNTVERKTYELKQGDVIFVRSSVKPDGVGLTVLVEDDLPNTVFSGFLIRFSGNHCLTSEYKEFCFNESGFRGRLTATSTISANTNINQNALKKLVLAFPSNPAEQRAIATALSDTDALLSSLDRLLAKKRDIKQAVMQQLLTGKQRLPGFSGEWTVRRIGDIVDVDPENLSSGTNPDYAFKYISLEDVDCGRLMGYTEQVFRTAPSRARRVVRKNDLLISTVRPNLRSHLFIQNQVFDTICSTGFCVLRCKSTAAYPAFLYFHFFARAIEQQIEVLVIGSNYPAINSGDVRALKVPLPPLEEQTAIAAVLLDIDAEIDSLTQKRDKTCVLKQGMMQELLTGRTRLV